MDTPKNIDIKVQEDQLNLTYYPCAGSDQLIVINAGIALKQSFYAKFATFLVGKQYNVLTWDARGIGQSATKPAKTDPIQFSDWGEHDFDSVLNYAHQTLGYAWENITLLAHSQGATISGLSQSLPKLKQLKFIASGTSSIERYTPKARAKLQLLWRLVIPAAVKFYNYLPGKFGVGADLPKGVVAQWRKWSLSKNYLFSDNQLNLTAYSAFTGQIDAVGFTDDIEFAPKACSEELLSNFPAASKNLTIFTPAELNQKYIGHLGFFKKEALFETIYQTLKFA